MRVLFRSRRRSDGGRDPHAGRRARQQGAAVMRETLSASRSRAMLRTAMGPTIVAALADAEVIEIMINPDGRLWLDRLGRGRWDTGYRFEPEQVARIIRQIGRAHV